jgi:hypothetical protein
MLAAGGVLAKTDLPGVSALLRAALVRRIARRGAASIRTCKANDC